MEIQTSKIAQYWNTHIHDLAVVSSPVGSRDFFQELEDYRFDKLRYLPRLVDFSGYNDKDLLEVGCGAGIDLARFAMEGAKVTGIDLSRTAIDLAHRNFALNGLWGDLRVMDGEQMDFDSDRFDVVYAHGVLQYTAHPEKMLSEIHRVLKPGGQGILMVYNRYSWLNAMSHVFNVGLEHEDAPVLRKWSISEFKDMLSRFRNVRIVVERFPVRSRLHSGLKGTLYNTVFVGTFNTIPRPLVRPFGWHIMAWVEK